MQSHCVHTSHAVTLRAHVTAVTLRAHVTAITLHATHHMVQGSITTCSRVTRSVILPRSEQHVVRNCSYTGA
eukprot:1160502-Pelagomonas_calceolata.AAC.2